MKGFVLVLLALFTIPALAQFKKGDKVLSGSISFYRSDGVNDDSSIEATWLVNPRFGFLINSRLEIGPSFGLSTHKIKSKLNPSEQTVVSFIPGVYVSAYFPVSEKFVLRVTGDMYYSITKEKWDLISPTENTIIRETRYAYGASVSPGCVFFPHDNWAVSMTVGRIFFNRFSVKDYDKVESDFGMDAGRVSLGVAYFFRKAESSK